MHRWMHRTSLRPDHTRVFTNGEMSGGGPQDAPPCGLAVGNESARLPCKRWTNAPRNGSHVYFREAMPGTTGRDVVTLPEYFRNHGYHTSGGGKVRLSLAPVPVSDCLA